MTAADTYPHDLAGEDARPPRTPPADILDAWRAYEAEQTPGLGDGPLIAGAAGNWRMAGSLITLLEEADAANPRRDKTSDGGIGDPRHQAAGKASDHNPWMIVAKVGVVRARDFDADGLDIPAAFERMRAKAHAGHLPQLRDGGYLIHAGKITTPDFAGWREYYGENPHVTHGHVSVSTDPARFDDRRPWGVWTPEAAPAPPKTTTRPPKTPQAPTGWHGPDADGSGLTFRAELGNNGPRVKALQAFLARTFPLYAKHLDVDGFYGPQTAAVLAEFARRSKIRADGATVGPQIARRLHVAGFRP